MDLERTNKLKTFTRDVRDILNSTEYGFVHETTENYNKYDLLNCYVTGKHCALSETSNDPTLMIATIHCRHIRIYPKWKLDTYLKLMELTLKLNKRNPYHFMINFTGNTPGKRNYWSFPEMMKIDLGE